MSQLIPFTNTNVPAHVLAKKGKGSLAAINFGGGGTKYKFISIEGKKFTVKDGDESTLLMNPHDPDSPATYLEVVILDIGPSADPKVNAKVWYASGYEKGSKAKPDCYSNDGQAPVKDAANPQANKCAICPKNVWGTGPNGSGTECRSSKRLVVATADRLDDPMLLRVPASSLTNLKTYLGSLHKAGADEPFYVVSRISFDQNATEQKLAFKPIGWAPAEAEEASQLELVKIIAGKKEAPKTEEEEPFENVLKVDDKPKPATKAAPAPKPAVADEDDDLPTTPKVKTEIQIEDVKPKKAAKVVEVEGSMEDALDDLDMDFDA